MRKYTHLIWDFNGTIFDDADAGIDATNKMLAERGIDIIPSKERYRELFDFPIKDYYKNLGFDFEKESYEEILAPMWVALYEKNAENSPLMPGVKETMERVSGLGIDQSVLSACEIGMLERYLERFGVRKYLSGVMGLGNIHAKGKLDLAIEWKNTHKGARALMVGDTTHDYDTAQTLGADCVLYAGGHQSRAKLEACGCPVVDSIEEIIELLDCNLY